MFKKIIKNSLLSLILICPLALAMDDSQPESWWRESRKKCIKTAEAADARIDVSPFVDYAYDLAVKADKVGAFHKDDSASCDRLRELASSAAHVLPKANVGERILVKSFYDGACNKQTLDSGSQTAQHIVRNFRNAQKQGLATCMQDPQFKRLLPELVAKEDELASKGYVTFVHGQGRKYRFPVLVHTFLSQRAKKEAMNDFLVVHINPPADEKKMQEDTDFRKKMLVEGVTSSLACDCDRLLFMNWALFANTTLCNSFWYAQNNGFFVDRVNSSKFRKSFEYSGFADLYPKYETLLRNLYHTYTNDLWTQKRWLRPVRYGTILLIAIPKEKLNDFVYYAHIGGYKNEMKVDGKPLEVSQIIEVFKKEDELLENRSKFSNKFFCMPMTADTALNPDSGIKVFAFETGDPQKLAAWHQEKDALLADLAKEIDKKTASA